MPWRKGFNHLSPKQPEPAEQKEPDTMTAKRILVLVAATAALVLGAETLEEINARLTVLGAEQIQLHGDTKDIAEALDRAFKSQKYDTPEMKKIRKEIDALQRQIDAAQAELRKKFEELPEFRGQVATVSTNAVRLRELAAERNRLYRVREQLGKDAAQQ
jgi:peptidoglycan hydrolase CwlO-like protein